MRIGERLHSSTDMDERTRPRHSILPSWSKEALVLAKLPRRRRWFHRDPRTWQDADAAKVPTTASQLEDRPPSVGGMLSASDDRVIPVLLFRLQP